MVLFFKETWRASGTVVLDATESLGTDCERHLVQICLGFIRQENPIMAVVEFQWSATAPLPFFVSTSDVIHRDRHNDYLQFFVSCQLSSQR